MPRYNENRTYSFEQNYHNNNDNNNYHEQYMQQQDHFLQQELQPERNQQEQQQQHQPIQYHFDFANIRDFHDPWEDYYENLENDRNENNANNEEEITNTSNENRNECNETERAIETCNENEFRPSPTPPPSLPQVEENRIESIGIIQNTEIEFERNHEMTPTANETTSAPTIEAAITLEHITSTNAEMHTASSREDSVDTTETQSSETLDIPNSQTYNESTHTEEAGLAGALSQLRLGEQRTPEQDAYEQLIRRQCWEQGQVDYSGKDSFDNIWKKITQTLDSKPFKEDDDKSAVKLSLSLTTINQILTGHLIQQKSTALLGSAPTTNVKNTTENDTKTIKAIAQKEAQNTEQTQPQQQQPQHPSSFKSRQRALRKFK